MAFEILDPTSDAASSTVLAPRVRDELRGGRIGVIWNGRPSGDIALREILGELSATHDAEVAVFEKKPLIGNMAPEEIFAKLTDKYVDFVLAGVGD